MLAMCEEFTLQINEQSFEVNTLINNIFMSRRQLAYSHNFLASKYAETTN